MVEIWKDIRDYEGEYQVSDWARVRSLDHWRDSGAGGYIQKGRILKSSKTKKGYLQVHLYKDRKKKTFLVHRLVWEAFNGTIPEGMQVNHISEDKTDNSLWNLNLMTPKENCNYGSRNKRVSVAKTNGKLSDPVLQLTLDEVLVKEWPSIREAGRNGFNQGSVSLCCNGKIKTYKGFKWVKKINYKMVG